MAEAGSSCDACLGLMAARAERRAVERGWGIGTMNQTELWPPGTNDGAVAEGADSQK